MQPQPPARPNPHVAEAQADNSPGSAASEEGSQSETQDRAGQSTAADSNTVLNEAAAESSQLDQDRPPGTAPRGAEEAPQHATRHMDRDRPPVVPQDEDDSFVVRAATAALVRSLQAAQLLSSSREGSVLGSSAATAPAAQDEEPPPPPPPHDGGGESMAWGSAHSRFGPQGQGQGQGNQAQPSQGRARGSRPPRVPVAAQARSSVEMTRALLKRLQRADDEAEARMAPPREAKGRAGGRGSCGGEKRGATRGGVRHVRMSQKSLPSKSRVLRARRRGDRSQAMEGKRRPGAARGSRSAGKGTGARLSLTEEDPDEDEHDSRSSHGGVSDEDWEGLVQANLSRVSEAETEAEEARVREGRERLKRRTLEAKLRGAESREDVLRRRVVELESSLAAGLTGSGGHAGVSGLESMLDQSDGPRALDQAQRQPAPVAQQQPAPAV